MTESNEKLGRDVERRQINIVCNNEEVLHHLMRSDLVAKSILSDTDQISFTHHEFTDEQLDQLGPKHFLISVPVYKDPTDLSKVISKQLNLLYCFGFARGKGEITPPFNYASFSMQGNLLVNVEKSVAYALRKLY